MRITTKALIVGCVKTRNQWFTLVLIAFICFTVGVFVFSGSTRKILARGAIPSLNNPVKSRHPLAAVARRRELAPQIIDVSFPVVYRNFIIQERRYGQYSF